MVIVGAKSEAFHNQSSVQELKYLSEQTQNVGHLVKINFIHQQEKVDLQ